ncbi:helix-turn-helix domain-containing protein [Enterococcus ureasiticus]|uniref:Transcriptional regulator n=1 Tax=Enterococcus ureasiticus TaxID=903984 RepID=A0A1E5GIT7_9ENTE|nr:helix-turn-helix transcriptional regulator [Enterococcus ureasiticus]OEG12160.1 transcriptional regulator [Enterococcus ureasiticus]
MDYIRRIRELREDNDYTQREVAALLNVGQRTYADYEYGKTRIPLDSIIKLAKFYNVDMNYICGVSDMKMQFPNKKGK